MRSSLMLLAVCVAFSTGCASKQKSVKSDLADKPATSALSIAQKDVAAIPASAEVLQDILLKLKRVHFGFDSVQLHKEAQTALSEAAEQLRKYGDVELIVEGHADDRGTTEYNMALSDRRARVVMDYLSKLGINKDRLQIIPKGAEDPLDAGKNVRSWAINRRVDFQLKQGKVKFLVEEGVLFDDAGNPIA